MKRATKQQTTRGPQGWGVGQLTLVEHSLCPLDSRVALVENLVYDTSFSYADVNRKVRQGQVKLFCPQGLAPDDEFYLWGLLALTLRDANSQGELWATPHYCLRSLNVIDHQARRGGRQYRRFAEAIARLSLVRYRNNAFYDPLRKEHRQVSFGFFSYSLPVDPDSSRAWRIVWDPLFFEMVKPVGGQFRFDLERYRSLDAACRRMFLLLSKVFYRRKFTPNWELRHLATNLIGYSPGLSTKSLKQKLTACLERLRETDLISDDPSSCIERIGRGTYRVRLTRGQYFCRAVPSRSVSDLTESPLVEPLKEIGLDDSAVASVLRSYPSATLRQWIDVTLAAKERHGPRFFKRSPAAFLMDNLKNAARGGRTPPDWWSELKKSEDRRRMARRAREKSEPTPISTLLNVTDSDPVSAGQQLYTQLVEAGQCLLAARENADCFTQEIARRRSKQKN